MNSLLEIKNLNITFNINKQQIKAVKDISFNIDENETFALVGESGAGKSVTAHSLMKLLPSYASITGELLFNNRNILKINEKEIQNLRGQDLSIIFQEPMTSLNPLHTIEKQIKEVLTLHKYSNESEHNLKNKIIELLHLVQIPNAEEYMAKYAHQLSGGERQRIMIAMALANEPKLLIADEPTTALDVTIQAEILKLLNDLKNTFKMSLLLITHDLSIVKRMADRIGIMHDGILVEVNTNTEIFNNPQQEYTKFLLSAEPKNKLIEVSPKAKELLKTKDLKVYFPITKGAFRKVVNYTKAVDGVSFSIKTGQTIGLVGESGSGKTTLGMAILKLVLSKGEISFKNIRIDSLKRKQIQPFRKEIQIVFQDPYASLNPRLTIGEIIEEGLAVNNIGKNKYDREKLIKKALKEVDLDPSYIDRYPH